MNTALDRLAEMVRRAEANATSQKLEAEIKEAAEQLRIAEARNRAAHETLQDATLRRSRDLDEVEVQEQQLKELIQKAAKFKSHLEASTEVESLITSVRNEIDTKRRTAREELDAAEREADEARRELPAAMQRNQDLRRTLDRLQPELAEHFVSDDRLAQQADIYFPAGQLRALEQEVDDSGRHFGALSRPEQYAQLKIWIGRLRRLQSMDLSEEDQMHARRIFPMLVEISKRHEPGYIEAFRQEFRTNWDVFIAQAQEELQQAAALSRQKVESERQQREQQKLLEQKRRHAREEAQTAIEELKGVIAGFDLPNEGMDEFRTALRKVTGHGTSDPELLELVLPYRELIAEGGEFRALRRNLDRLQQERDAAEEAQAPGEDISDLLSVTKGMKVVMIGGARREDVRRQLLQLFEFGRLDWEDYEGTKPAMLDSLEQRIRNRGIDLMLILKRFISHHVPERFRPLCEQYGIPCLMVEQGYGAAQVTRTLRNGLLQRQD
jgi:hypothetical protein